jgi:hypothetical protein
MGDDSKKLGRVCGDSMLLAHGNRHAAHELQKSTSVLLASLQRQLGELKYFHLPEADALIVEWGETLRDIRELVNAIARSDERREMENFVTVENVRLFLGRLEAESKAEMRRTLGSLLIDQVNRLSSRSERLEQTNIFVSELEGRIERQREIIAQYPDLPERAEISRQRLANMEATLQFLEDYKRQILEEIDREAV